MSHPIECAPEDLVRELRTLRESIGLSQRELAHRADMSQAEISRLESGRHAPSLALLRRIAAAIGVTITVTIRNAVT